MLRRFLRVTLSSMVYFIKRVLRIKPRGIIVLTYHRVNDHLSVDSLVTPVSVFREQMRYLKENCVVIGLDGVFKGVDVKTDKPRVLITFDDGYLDNYENAFGVLKEFGLTAVVFLTAGYINTDKKTRRYTDVPWTRDFLNQDEIKEMADYGITFGAHTVNHAHLTDITGYEAEHEIKASKAMIEALIGQEVKSFCYPCGEYDQDVKNLVKNAGFEMAFTVQPGVNNKRTNVFELCRTGTNGQDSLFDFKKKLLGAYDLLHFIVQFFKRRRIIKPGTRTKMFYASSENEKAPVIVYLLSQFPETHETFILREIKALKEQGVCLKILSLKPCRDTVIHPDAEKLMAETVYGRISIFWSLSYILRHPLKVWSVFGYLLGAYLESPRELIKGLYVLAECLYFVKALKGSKIKHIHSHCATMPTTAAVILSRLTGVTFSFTAHAWDIFVNSNGLAEKIKQAKFAVTCTDYNRRYLAGLNGNGRSLHKQKIYLNYHGLDLNEFGFSREQGRPLKLLTVGRLVETKGFSYLIKACEMLRKKGIEFSCDIVGQGPLKDFLQLQVTCYNLENRVKFLGVQSQEEIKRLYAQASLFVLPCVVAENGDRDGIPNVLLEAMAMGLPVIATDVSGIPEAVQDRETGLLVSPKDSFALTDAIIELYSNGDLKAKITENARGLVERQFDVQKNIRELMGIYMDNGVLDRAL